VFVSIRLICVGYLKEENCISSYRVFLKEMKHLDEYRALLAAGCEYPTSICGKSLKAMLNEYGNMIVSGKYHLFVSSFCVTCSLCYMYAIFCYYLR